MTDPNAKAKLFFELRADDENLWSIVSDLANMPEPERRRLLRPHAEAEFDLAASAVCYCDLGLTSLEPQM
jgi:hypothetical protein